ncbi:Alpha/Beta hydrolase protein [Entophlyctis helioformis]|nr:Alpha/Beta hydrolase protein [Entophlyctis helioformis]
MKISRRPLGISAKPLHSHSLGSDRLRSIGFHGQLESCQPTPMSSDPSDKGLVAVAASNRASLTQPADRLACTGKTITLRDGRTLAYEEYICPASTGSDSLPTVLLFPGIPGSRLFTHPLVAQGSPLGIRLLSIDRPGLGLSTPKPNRQISDWPADVAELLDQLHLDKVSVIGYSAGGPYALAVAHALPDRLHKVAVVSSISPRDAPGIYTNMTFTYKLAWFLAAHWPSLLKMIVTTGAANARKDPVAFQREDLAMMPPTDQEIVTRPDVEAMFVASVVELYGRRQEGTIADEFCCWGRPWGFDLAGIRAPVRVWHGARDTGTTLPMGQWIAAQIGCSIVVDTDGGHMLYFTAFEEILAWLRAPVGQRKSLDVAA